MADRTQIVPENTPGAFFVDHTCIDCELCREKAPANFTRQEQEGYSYVYRQPRDDQERQACQAALEECPVEAIGNDG
jgi:ferredoxin